MRCPLEVRSFTTSIALLYRLYAAVKIWDSSSGFSEAAVSIVGGKSEPIVGYDEARVERPREAAEVYCMDGGYAVVGYC